MEKAAFTLLEVARGIQKTIADRYKTAVWIRAELNKLNFYKQSGHCFPELVEKQEGRIVAQMKATIWKDDFVMINRNFLRVLHEPVKDGIKILFLANISFDPVYGLALRITDIDPAFTLGDLEREKQETIQKLRDENIFDRNKRRSLALLPKRVAIISVATSKGYADFIKIMDGNTRGYRFFHMLFPSLLQGEKAVGDMIRQLKRIRAAADHFDAVAIVRGGGDEIGLSCYNHIMLAREIANFPLPVFTGIGHATNETVSEMISFYNAITPTKLAEWILEKFNNYENAVLRAQERISEGATRLISGKKSGFRAEVKLFRTLTENRLLQSKNEIFSQVRSLIQYSKFRFRNEFSQLKQYSAQILISSSSMLKNNNIEINHIVNNVKNLSPEHVLRRGYSITKLNGRSVRNIGEIKAGDTLNTTVFDGEISSRVSSTSKKENNE